VARTVTKLLQDAPQIIYLLDRECQQCLWRTNKCHVIATTYLAVIGDAGRMYVPADVISVYRSLLPKASIITPNWFEVEYVLVRVCRRHQSHMTHRVKQGAD
jgi:hydroxymethylpyrimidine/phosphomethylpyrimidine kinase